MTVLSQRLKIETNFEDAFESIYCKQNTEIKRCTYQCPEQLEATPYQKNPEPIVVRGNQLTASAVNSTSHFNHVENQLCITWHSLMQLINNF